MTGTGPWYMISGILFMYCCYFRSTVSEGFRRHYRNSSIGSSESCETSPVRRNVTLRGGFKAGYFHKLAQYVAMELCIQLCCQEKGCDVAFMIGKNCYGVKCFSEQLCRVVPARNAPKALLISKVDFRGEVYLQKFMPEKLKCFKTLVETNVTLHGGLTAGNFTAIGLAESIDVCAKFCCVKDNCDLALLVDDHCFMVTCSSVQQCTTKPIMSSTFQTYIARVNRTKEAAKDQPTVRALSSISGKSLKLMCKNGVVQHNHTLLGGYDAGKFKTLAHSTNMSTCIRLCCGEKTCDVALMIENKCYGVACRNLKQCRTIPAKNSAILSHLNPRVSYITSRNEEVNSIILRRHSEICKSNVISYDVTLRGGKHAGKYKTFGEVEDMGECIRICCMEKYCDVAFMISGVCFTVRCYSEEACQEVRAPGTGFKPMLSYVVREKPMKHKVRNHARKHRNRHPKQHKRVKGHGNVPKNKTISPDVPHIPSPNLPSLDNDHYCTNSEIMYNVTLQGGIGAGKFRDRGVLPNMQECLRICCIATSCDLAFMLGNHCFSVTCKNQALCEVVTARSSKYNPRVAYIYARSNKADRETEPNKQSKIKKDHSRNKSPVIRKKKLRKNRKRRKHKKINEISTAHHKNITKTSYSEDMLLLEKFSLKKLKLENMTRNKNHQAQPSATDTTLSQAFVGTIASRNSTNTTTPTGKSYKNNTNSSNKNTTTLPLGKPISPLRNNKEGKKISTNESFLEDDSLSAKMHGNSTSSETKSSEPKIHNVTGNILSNNRSTKFENFSENTAPSSTTYHTVPLLKMVTEIHSPLAHDSEEKSVFVSSDEENDRSNNNTVSLQEMSSETTETPSKQASDRIFPKDLLKNGAGKNQTTSHRIDANEVTGSSSKVDLNEKDVSRNNNVNNTTEHLVSSGPPLVNTTHALLSKQNGKGNDFSGKGNSTEQANKTDLILQEAFEFEPESKFGNTSEEVIQFGLPSPALAPPPSGKHTKRGEVETNKLDIKSNIETTKKSFVPNTSTVKTDTYVKKVRGVRLTSLWNQPNVLSRSFQPLNSTERT